MKHLRLGIGENPEPLYVNASIF